MCTNVWYPKNIIHQYILKNQMKWKFHEQCMKRSYEQASTLMKKSVLFVFIFVYVCFTKTYTKVCFTVGTH